MNDCSAQILFIRLFILLILSCLFLGPAEALVCWLDLR